LHKISDFLFRHVLKEWNTHRKNKDGTISLVTQHSETSKNVFEELKKFKLLLQPYPNSRITFIEIPHYSLTKWNIHAKKSPTEDRPNIVFWLFSASSLSEFG
jgi:hypothetical protein